MRFDADLLSGLAETYVPPLIEAELVEQVTFTHPSSTRSATR